MRLTVLSCALALAACGSSSPEPNVTPTPAPIASATPTEPTPPTPEQAQLFARASNAFGLELWSHLRSERGNQIVSPASIAVALDMTFAGARGETAAEMARVLRAPSDAAALHEAAGNVLSTWNDPSREAYTLAVANRLFGERTYTFEEPFLALTRTTYRAPLEPLDFRSAADASRVAINGWVAEQTRDRIRDLLPPASIDDQTRLVLVNAVYFLARWATEFETHSTQPRPFFVDGAGSGAPVPTMHRTGLMRYGEVDGAQVLELPYRQNEVGMTIVLPRERDGLGALEEGLDPERLERWVASLEDGHRVALALPKFRIAPPTSLRLADLLQQMNMRLAFSRERADFTGIANPPSPADRLYVSQVFHKAFVAVDEQGTEAAAATAVVMARAGSGMPPEPPIELRADHPFLFFIRDLRSGTVLFMGRLTDPR
ncbi:MAG: serpin family protein [Sandaracinaceae bacterium]|nr:serpin family protein [Sandaracinaceae bacterium]